MIGMRLIIDFFFLLVGVLFEFFVIVLVYGLMRRVFENFYDMNVEVNGFCDFGFFNFCWNDWIVKVFEIL